MKGQQELGVKGSYSLRVFKEDGAEVKDKYIPFVQNTVTDIGLESYFLSRSGLFSSDTQVVVGTGTSGIQSTSTSLGNVFATTASSISGIILPRVHTDNGDGTVTSKLDISLGFDIGVFNGDLISEVGIKNDFGSGNLYAGQLIKDQNGNPTTITILSDEQLVVEYTIEVTFWHTRQEVAIMNVTINGVSTTARLKVNPYLRRSNLSNGSDDTIFSEFVTDEFAVYDSTGSLIKGFRGVGTDIVHSVSGNIGTLSFNHTFSPSDFNSTDLKYIGFGQDSGSVTDPFADREIIIILEFDTPVEKTSSQAMTIDFSVDVTATRL